MRNFHLLYSFALLITCSRGFTTAWAPATTTRRTTTTNSIHQQPFGNQIQSTSASKSALFFAPQRSNRHRPSIVIDIASSKISVIDKSSSSTRTQTTKLDAAPTSIANSLPFANSPKALIAISIIGHVLGGLIGTPFVIRATRGPVSWYRKISLPSWTPPDAIFGPVWSTLYALMGLAIGRLWNATASNPQPMNILALGLWTVHYIINVLWAPTFFGMKKLRLASIMNGLLLSTLIPVIVLLGFHIQPVPQPATAALLLPYLGWLTFATFLNENICKRNPTDTKFGGYNEARLQADLAKLQQQAARFANGK
ncbi:unnamed protein product [Cylindrotheca closterium]|uniref:TspO/MBR-related protein n=1 Tax=Cylindrotheca closterium TaxID=2856 RepID=A0AAD2JH18_9STRA|nr:unnamed protein product [Cylindrotheca closterium]